MKKIVVTVIGADSVGIVAGVTKELALQNINILDISQTILGEYFAMIMLVDLSEATEELSALAKECSELGKKIGMSVYMQHEDIFNAMHNV